MIRVLHSVSNMDRAGIETMLMNYYQHIDREKIQFDFLVNKPKPGDYDDEIRRMGARVRVADRMAIIEGVTQLYGAPVTATDLRAGAALIVAGLMAKGVTEIYEPKYIDRGYDRIEEKLRSLGATISRERGE